MGNLFEDVEPLTYVVDESLGPFKVGDVVMCELIFHQNQQFGSIRIGYMYTVTRTIDSRARGQTVLLSEGGQQINSYYYPAACFRLMRRTEFHDTGGPNG